VYTKSQNPFDFKTLRLARRVQLRTDISRHQCLTSTHLVHFKPSSEQHLRLTSPHQASRTGDTSATRPSCTHLVHFHYDTPSYNSKSRFGAANSRQATIVTQPTTRSPGAGAWKMRRSPASVHDRLLIFPSIMNVSQYTHLTWCVSKYGWAAALYSRVTL